MKKTADDKAFDTISMTIIVISVLLALLPFLYIVAISFSSSASILAGKVSFYPKQFTIEAYRSVIHSGSVLYSIGYTVVITAIHTLLAMILTICAAYPLTKKRLRGRGFFLILIIVTMYFSGGIIPDYLLMKSLHLTNTMWVLIIPGCISAFNLIILKSFFTSLPDSLEEAARLDGCSDIKVLMKIIIPLSGPVIATLSLFYAVGRWNGFQDALIYITNPKLYPIQLKLYQIISNASSVEILRNEGAQAAGQVIPASIQSASIVIATIPILILYPWLQKYFVAGKIGRAHV
mgnify:FL=1